MDMSTDSIEARDEWSKYETNRKLMESNMSAYAKQGAELNPRRKCLHKFFILYSAIAGISAFALALGQLLGMAIENLPAEVNEAVRYSLSLYLVIMCFLAVLIELGWFSFITKSRILTNWISRGLVYIFMALLSIDQSSLSETSNETELYFINFISYFFGAVGLGYVVMGVLCMKMCLKKMQEEHQLEADKRKKRDNALETNPLNHA